MVGLPVIPGIVNIGGPNTGVTAIGGVQSIRQ